MTTKTPKLEEAQKEIEFENYQEGGLPETVAGKAVLEEQKKNSEGTNSTESSSNNIGNWWFIEIWYENREIFKSFVEHIIFTFLPLIFLFFVEWLIENSQLPKDRKDILEFIDFCCIAVFLVIFAINFLIKVLIFITSGTKENE